MKFFLAAFAAVLFTTQTSTAQDAPSIPKKPADRVEGDVDDGEPESDMGQTPIPPPPSIPQTEEAPPIPLIDDGDDSGYNQDSGSSPGDSGFMGVPQVEREAHSPSERPVTQQAEGQPVEGETPTTQSIIKERMARRQARLDHQVLFGAYRLHLMALKPTFQANSTYERVYGTSSIMPSLAVDYFFFDWYATLGLTFRLSIFNDSGEAVVKKGDTLESDSDGKVAISFYPLQTGLTFQTTPFSFKWLVLSGWVGGEAAYYQEVRKRADESNTSSGGEEGDKRTYSNVGWRYATVFGGALSIRIDGLEPQNAASLAVMNLRAIYLTPYVEIAQGVGDEDFQLSRQTIGLGFTFETIY